MYAFALLVGVWQLSSSYFKNRALGWQSTACCASRPFLWAVARHLLIPSSPGPVRGQRHLQVLAAPQSGRRRKSGTACPLTCHNPSTGTGVLPGDHCYSATSDSCRPAGLSGISSAQQGDSTDQIWSALVEWQEAQGMSL